MEFEPKVVSNRQKKVNGGFLEYPDIGKIDVLFAYTIIHPQPSILLVIRASLLTLSLSEILLNENLIIKKRRGEKKSYL